MILALTNAVLACPVGGVSKGNVLVRDGVVVATGVVDIPSDSEIVDCGGKTIAPGIVDLGVAKVDRAAFRAGGIVRIGLMPDQSPVLDDPGIVQRAALIGKPDLWIHPIAAATRGLAGNDLAEMAICLSAGAKAVGTGKHWIADSGVMRRVLAYARDLDVTVIAHAEDGGLTAGAVATEGEMVMDEVKKLARRLGDPLSPQNPILANLQNLASNAKAVITTSAVVLTFDGRSRRSAST